MDRIFLLIEEIFLIIDTALLVFLLLCGFKSLYDSLPLTFLLTMMSPLILTIASLLAILLIFSGIWRFLRWRNSPQRRGQLAEKKVRKALSSFKGEEYHLINDIIIASPSFDGRPPRQTQIDHILISVKGLFVIETKGLTGHITGAEHSQFWNQKFMMNARSFYNPLLQNQSHIRALRRILPDLRTLPEEALVSAVVFTDPWRLDILADDLIVTRQLMPDLHIRRTLDPEREVRRRWWRPRRRQVVLDKSILVLRLPTLLREIKRRPAILSVEQVSRFAEHLEAVRAKNEGLKGQQAKMVGNIERANEQKIRAGICPRCGGALVTRQGEYGPFLACSRYPACRFVCSAAPPK